MDIQLHLLAEGSTSYGYVPEPLLLELCLHDPCPHDPYPHELCLLKLWAVGRVAAERLRIGLRCGGKLAKWTYSYTYRCSRNIGGEDECQSAGSDEELQSRTC